MNNRPIPDFAMAARKAPRTGGVRLILATACLAALTACEALDLGPAPNTYIGPASQPGPLTAILPTTVTEISRGTSQPADGMSGILPATATAPATPATSQPATVAATTTAPATTAAATTQPASLTVGLRDVILTMLENNPSLRVQRINPLISRTGEETARSVFDPTLTGGVSAGRSASPSGLDTNQPQHDHGIPTSSVNGNIGVSEFLPTGTTIGGTLTSSYSSSPYFTETSTRAGVTVNQSLLQGAGLDVNLASLRQAQIDTRVSQYELRGFAETLVAQVEQTYWDLALAQQQIDIFEQSLKLATEQLRQTDELIRVQRLAANERAAAVAEVALRNEDLINARSALATTQLHLLQLMNPGKVDFWKQQLVLREQPFVPRGDVDPADAYAAVAMRFRPDLNQARLEIQRGDLEIVKTKNGLLPKLDLFINMGKTGYARSFGGTIPALNGPDYDALVGLQFSYPVTNAAARAAYRSSTLSKEQAQESLDNLTQLAQLDVRTAWIEVERTQAQIPATQATVEAQAAALRAETQKFRVGRSTNILVAQAQRDYTQARINQVSAVVNYLKALVSLYEQEGSLLERRGLQAPGGTPATVEVARKPGTEANLR
jgi:outer membrane protein TolC